jgi:ribosomal protein L11 methyltransferase
MFSLFIVCQQDDFDILIAELWEAGVTGIVEGPGGLTAFFAAQADRDALAARFGGSVEASDDHDRSAASSELLQPAMVGRRFYLVPAWSGDAVPEGRIRVRINSGLVFRRGDYRTARLGLEALEDLVWSGMTVVDIGTGSGILAEAAKKLGAGKVIACDINSQSVAVARANFHHSGVEIDLYESSIEGVESGIADLTIAKMSPERPSSLARELARITKSCGAILLIGLQTENVQCTRDHLADLGFTIEGIHADEECCALVLRQVSDQITVH